MINELFLYGRDDSLFKSIVVQSSVLQGRYHVSPNYGHDLNTNNLESFIKDPKYGLSDVKQKYPICVCTTPRSRPNRINGSLWEQFFFSLFFLQRTGYDGQNKIKLRDKDTNTSEHHIWMDWSEMKNSAIEFMNTLEATMAGNITVDDDIFPFRMFLNIDFERFDIRRLSNFNNDKISGVEMAFNLQLNLNVCEISSDGTSYTIPYLGGEDDPIWTSERNNYYTKQQVIDLLEGNIVVQDRWVLNETPQGLVNGVNATYYTFFPFEPGTCNVFLNGQEQNIIDDYQEIGGTHVQFTTSPQPPDKIRIDYKKS